MDIDPHFVERAAYVALLIRQVVLFMLGVGLMIDAVVQTGDHDFQLTVGLILVGLVPVDIFLSRLVAAGQARSEEAQ